MDEIDKAQQTTGDVDPKTATLANLIGDPHVREYPRRILRDLRNEYTRFARMGSFEGQRVALDTLESLVCNLIMDGYPEMFENSANNPHLDPPKYFILPTRVRIYRAERRLQLDLSVDKLGAIEVLEADLKPKASHRYSELGFVGKGKIIEKIEEISKWAFGIELNPKTDRPWYWRVKI